MISAVVLTRNEKKNIENCLRLLHWCDEVVIIDDYSTDGTRMIAARLGARVYKHHLAGDFAAQRNFGLRKAKGRWVLFIDADERVTPRLAKEIKKAVRKNNFDGFWLRRCDFLWNMKLKHGETARIRLLRLAKKGTGKWQRRVHETWEIEGRAKKLKNPITHYPHQTIDEFVEHLNFHSTLHARALLNEHSKRGFFWVAFNPLAKFLQNWCFRFGFLDKTAGLVVALMMSFHSFLAWSKFYLKKSEDKK